MPVRTFGHCAITRRSADTFTVPTRGNGSARRIVVGLSIAAVVGALGPLAVAATGDVTGYDVPTPMALPHGVVTGPDDAIWFTERAANQIGRLDASGTFTEYPLEGSDPTVIVVGPDGNLWFTEQAGNRIGRIDPAGALVEWELSNPASAPAGIAAGADGNLWITLRAASAIGRLSPDLLTYDEFATPTPDALPTSIVAGPDGNLWFTERAVDKLGRVAVDGTIDEFDLPSGSLATGIAVGSDGNLWVTLRARNSIAKVSTDGTLLAEYVIPSENANASWITPGPGGDLWFTETGPDKVGRVTTSGAFTEYALATGANAQGITHGPDGLPWFAEGNANRIARLELSTPDETAPTIEIRTPTDDTVLLLGAWLPSDYGCTDEPGGSGLVRCEGPVPSGDGVPTDLLGARRFRVEAEDAAGNASSAATHYLVFRSVEGTIFAGAARPGGWLTLELGMDLVDRGVSPLASAVSTPVACGDPSQALGIPEDAAVRWRVDPRGVLVLRWDTDRNWGGQCRMLTVTFAAPGWEGPSASFLAVFADGNGGGRGV
jgi:virginiamycin B lyase